MFHAWGTGESLKSQVSNSAASVLLVYVYNEHRSIFALLSTILFDQKLCRCNEIYRPHRGCQSCRFTTVAPDVQRHEVTAGGFKNRGGNFAVLASYTRTEFRRGQNFLRPPRPISVCIAFCIRSRKASLSGSSRTDEDRPGVRRNARGWSEQTWSRKERRTTTRKTHGEEERKVREGGKCREKRMESERLQCRLDFHLFSLSLVSLSPSLYTYSRRCHISWRGNFCVSSTLECVSFRIRELRPLYTPCAAKPEFNPATLSNPHAFRDTP